MNQKKRKSLPATVKVFRLAGFDRRNGIVHGRANYKQMAPLKRAEANILVSYGYAVWRGRGERQINLLIPTNALLLFIGQMRFKPTPEASGLDSRTHKRLGGLRGYKHVRNVNFTPLADQVMQLGNETDLGKAIASLFRAEESSTLNLKDNRERIQHLHSVIAEQLQQHA